MPPFKWEDIDHNLISLKHTDLADELRGRMKKEEATIRFENRGNLNNCAVPTLILEMQKKYTDEWARRVYEIYCDVWQIQGSEKSAAFIRAVCSQAVVPSIRARAGAIAFEFAMFAQRTNFSPQSRDAMLRGLDLEMKQLQSRWERRLEAEAKECEHVERRKPHASSDISIRVGSRQVVISEGGAPTQLGTEDQPTGEAQRAAVIKKVQRPDLYVTVSTPEAALYFDVTERTIHRWLEANHLRRGGRAGSITTESIRSWDKKRSSKRRHS